MFWNDVLEMLLLFEKGGMDQVGTERRWEGPSSLTSQRGGGVQMSVSQMQLITVNISVRVEIMLMVTQHTRRGRIIQAASVDLHHISSDIMVVHDTKQF